MVTTINTGQQPFGGFVLVDKSIQSLAKKSKRRAKE